MSKHWLLLLGISTSALLTACTVAVLPSMRLGPVVPGLRGQVSDQVRTLEAATADVANGATIALINSSTGVTVATTVSDRSGIFTLDFGPTFTPNGAQPYYLEAIKGLPMGGVPNRAGAPLARLRTLVFYDETSNTWTSLTSGVPGATLKLGRGTTAIATLANLRGLTVHQQTELAGKVDGASFAAAGTAIAATDYAIVYGLVTDALTNNQDPLESVTYDPGQLLPANQYQRKAGTEILYDAFTPAKGVGGGTVTLTGQGLSDTDTVAIGALKIAAKAANALHTELALTLADQAYSGWIHLGPGDNTRLGPFIPVAKSVGTFVGNRLAGNVNGRGPAASIFETQGGLAMDLHGNLVLADGLNNQIKLISPNGTVSTLAGSGTAGFVNGPAATAQFSNPLAVATDSSGNVYVSEASDRIRKITSDGNVTSLAGSGDAGFKDGGGSVAEFDTPGGLAVDADGTLYVADTNNHRIRMISPSGAVTTLAGGTEGYKDATGAAAMFDYPSGVAVDSTKTVFVADSQNNCLRKIAPGGVVTTFAGSQSPDSQDGQGIAASFNYPQGLCLDPSGNLYVADTYSYLLRFVTKTGAVSTLAGKNTDGITDGPAASALLDAPVGIAVDGLGNVFMSETASNLIRVYTP